MNHCLGESIVSCRLIAVALAGVGIMLADSRYPVQAVEPATPKLLKLTLRHRVPSATDAAQFEAKERVELWDPNKTAIIICDMWDLHHCKRAVDRVQEMAPRMNELVTKAREGGVFIIHAPSSCMAPYEDTPMRRRAKN